MLQIFATVLPVISQSKPSDIHPYLFKEAVIHTGKPEKMLSFDQRQIKMDTAEQAESVAREIEAFQPLTVLELKGNTVGVAAGERLARALSGHPELERCLWSDMFTGRLKHEIPPILRSMCSSMIQAGCNITELDLSDNAFGPIGAEGISDFLVSPSAYSLEVLRLNNNGLGAGGKIVAECLLRCCENAKRDGRRLQLKTFVAGRNRLEDPGAIALSKAFKEIGTLEVISIPQNGIRSKGITALAESLHYNPNIRVVNFNDNTCGVEGATEISYAIGSLMNLEVLDLGDCLCRDAGVIAVAGALCDGEHHQLQMLDISGSELSAYAADEVLDVWISTYGDFETVKLIIKNNCFGSRFDELAALADEYNIDFGDEEDDEGSMSERESGTESESEEDEDEAESSDSDVDVAAAPAPASGGPVQAAPPAAAPATAPFSMDDLLKGVGCMKMGDAGAPVQAAPAVFGAAPAAFGAAPAAFGTVPSAFGAAPAAFGTVPSAFGAAPAAFGAAPAVFGTAPVFNFQPAQKSAAAAAPVSVTVSFLNEQRKLNTREEGEQIADVIRASAGMTVLELRGNTLGIPAGEAIAEALKTKPQLQRCLWSDLFTGRMKTEIPPILKSMCSAMMQAGAHITELDLSDNAFGPIGADGIQEFLRSPSAYTLEVLNLNNCGLGAGGKVVAACLIECHANSVKAGRPLRLKSFTAGRNRLEIPGARALAQAFKTLGSLEEIVMHQDGIGAKGIVALAKALPFNPNLRIINLNDNTATQSGSYALAKAIRTLSRLVEIRVGDCLCRDQGCHAIVDSLSPKTHPNLTDLDLSGAELSGEAALNIASKWTSCFETARLNISSNNFGGLWDDVAEAVHDTNIDIGDYDDDQGSLSDDEEERNSEPDSDSDEEEEDEIQVVDQGNSGDYVKKAEQFRATMDRIANDFLSASQEASARLLLELACLIQSANGHPDVVAEAVNVADDVVTRVSEVRRRPIPTTTQLVNQLCAQMGFVKAEDNWGLRPQLVHLNALLQPLIAKGHFADEIDTIRHYFKTV